jgi:hypothetical protein
LLLELQLRARSEVLQGASTANAEMHAPGSDSIGRWRDDLRKTAFIEVSSSLRADPFDLLARQRIVDENRFSFDMSDSTSLVGKIRDLRVLRHCGWLHARVQQPDSRHALRNSSK